jgi:hypothetical protein
VLLACSQHSYTMSQVMVRTYSVTATMNRIADNATWTVTRVYGPQDDNDKQHFMQELRQIKQTVSECWILMGGFNLIYKASDKSSHRVNRRLINNFRAVLEDPEVKALHLHDRRFM